MNNEPASAQSQAELFRKMAADYDFAIRVFQPTYDSMLKLSTDLACTAAPGNARCLDYGTGTGAALPLLACHFDELVAVDPGEAMLALARARVADTVNGDNARVTFVQGTTASQAPALAVGTFDAVHCSLVLMFVETEDVKLATLRTLHDALRPGGVLVLTELVCDPQPEEERKVLEHWRSIMRHRGAGEELMDKGERQIHGIMHRRTPEQLLQLLALAGFSEVLPVFQTLHTTMFVGFKR